MVMSCMRMGGVVGDRRDISIPQVCRVRGMIRCNTLGTKYVLKSRPKNHLSYIRRQVN